MSQAASWDPAIKLSVNISPTQLTDSWLAQRIVRLLAEAGFPAERLVVEITESSLFADLDLARAIVTSHWSTSGPPTRTIAESVRALSDDVVTLA